MLALALALLAAAVGPVAPDTGVPQWETVDRHCDYMFEEEGTTYQGPCVEFFDYTTGEHRVSFQDRVFAIEEYDPMRHELPWMFLKMNAQPAVAYQRHRSWTSYTTMDFKHVLDVCDEADETGSCR